MNRSNYGDGYDTWQTIMWRGAVSSAIRGKRGQTFIKELIEALDAMPDKRLITGQLQKDGCNCALGVVATARNVDTAPIEFPEDQYEIDEWHSQRVADALNIADALAREVMWVNDEFYERNDYALVEGRWLRVHGPKQDPDVFRWQAVRKWAQQKLRAERA